MPENDAASTPPVIGAFIEIDEANGYIQEFLDNHYDPESFGTVNTKSFILNADLVRQYLADPAVKNVKLMLGVREVDGTKYPSIMFAGYDSNGDYVNAGPNKNMVLDHCAQCPPACPVSGTARQDLIS